MQARGSRSLAIAAIVAVEGVGAWLAFQTSRVGTAGFWLLAGGPTVALAVVALLWARRDGVLGDWLRPRSGDVALGALVAALLFAGAYAFTKAVCPPESAREIWIVRLYLQLGDPDDLRAHLPLMLSGLATVAAAEEIVWRGLVARLYAEGFGSRGAWVAQALFYALAYVPTLMTLGPSVHTLNPILPIAALGAGLVWGLLAERMGRLTPGIVAHALFDWAVVVLFRLWGGSL